MVGTQLFLDRCNLTKFANLPKCHQMKQYKCGDRKASHFSIFKGNLYERNHKDE
jgi:hypothetical protein